MIYGNRWIGFPVGDSVRAYLPHEAVAPGVTAAQMAIKRAGTYDGPTLGQALTFAGLSAEGSKIDRWAEAAAAADKALAVLDKLMEPQTPDPEEALYFAAPPPDEREEPDWLKAIPRLPWNAQLIKALADYRDGCREERKAAYEACRPIIDEASEAGEPL